MGSSLHPSYKLHCFHNSPLHSIKSFRRCKKYGAHLRVLEAGCSIADQTPRQVMINSTRQALDVMQLLMQTPWQGNNRITPRFELGFKCLCALRQVAGLACIPPRIFWSPLVDARRHPHKHVAGIGKPKKCSFLQSECLFEEAQKASYRCQVLKRRVILFVIGSPGRGKHVGGGWHSES